MLTLRNKSIKAGLQNILKNLEQMEQADKNYKEFNLALSQNTIYSKKYKDQQLAEAHESYEITVTSCAKAISGELQTICGLIEALPEPVEMNNESAQNMLSMIRLTECKLPFEQLQYYVDQSRGDFVLLKMLAEVFKGYKQDYFVNQCLELSKEFPLYKLQEMAGINGRVLYNPSNYNPHDWDWFIVDIKQFLKQLDSSVTAEPNYKEQVAKLKETLAARNREIELLKEKDASNIGVIDYLLNKE